ncbi:hypothetical protein P2O73_11655, partial [Escherichia coli]
SDGNGSHASTLKSPSYTKSVSWQHYRLDQDAETSFSLMNENKKALPKQCFQLTRQDSQGIASKRFISCG